MLAEDLAEVGRVDKADRPGNRLDGLVAFEQVAGRFFEPDILNELGRGEAGRGLEKVAVMAAAHAPALGQFLDAERLVEIVRHVAAHFFQHTFAQVVALAEPVDQPLVFDQEVKEGLLLGEAVAESAVADALEDFEGLGQQRLVGLDGDDRTPGLFLLVEAADHVRMIQHQVEKGPALRFGRQKIDMLGRNDGRKSHLWPYFVNRAAFAVAAVAGQGVLKDDKRVVRVAVPFEAVPVIIGGGRHRFKPGHEVIIAARLQQKPGPAGINLF